SSLVAHGWTHKSLNRENIIEANQISQIPAVKSYYLQNYLTNAYTYVIKGTHTGGDLIRFLRTKSDWNAVSAGGGIRLIINNKTAGQSYRIRFRYAADKASFFSVFLYPGGWNSNRFVALEKSYSGNYDDLKYSDFKFAEIITPPTPSSQIQMDVEMQANSFQSDVNVILDKIEFIPIDTTTLEYEGERNLEKTKNAVNDLFIN
ncbi:delta endotoxin C-terminal domain-containing protein, partial [Bacillus thuringiensis]|nr:delta endotoxin C-terminal domain-containing protein [Bacillus thuringiensis]